MQYEDLRAENPYVLSSFSAVSSLNHQNANVRRERTYLCFSVVPHHLQMKQHGGERTELRDEE